jgi:class III poly(R)-hydroxyalkanoic acid synthase PhaE subunit
LETQREWLQRWNAASAEQRVDALRETMEAWRKHMTTPSVETSGVLQKFQELLQTSFAGSAEWARTTAEGEHSAPLMRLFEALPLGLAREQQMAWQELARVAAESQSLTSQVGQALMQVVKAALERVPQEVEALTHRGEAPAGLRRLFDIWVEVGEQEFAKLAHDAQFIELQARMNNARTHLRRAQQRVLEYTLKEWDLPTRAELNSVHQRLRDLAARVEALEGERAQPKPRAKRRHPKGAAS